jgi:amino acid transporter
MTLATRISAASWVCYTAMAALCIVMLFPAQEPFESIGQYALVQSVGLCISLLLVAAGWVLVPKNAELINARRRAFVSLVVLFFVVAGYAVAAVFLNGFSVAFQQPDQLGHATSSLLRYFFGIAISVAIIVAVVYQLELTALRRDQSIC